MILKLHTNSALIVLEVDSDNALSTLLPQSIWNRCTLKRVFLTDETLGYKLNTLSSINAVSPDLTRINNQKLVFFRSLTIQAHGG